MAKNVRMIPATKMMHTGMPLDKLSRRKVAAYARVSTDSDEQFTSYEAQIDYYTKMIKSHHDWEFVKVYTDEGISGTNTKHRDGFNSMIEDALSGKMDLIVTKSVSRFARNTVDSLTTVRKLKEKGVEVYFEKENIYTLDSKGELLITIMSSLAQEESRSISENVTWGIRKKFSDGKVILPYKRFLGYEKGPDGLPQIVEDEAKIVREIYDMFLSGKSIGMICAALVEMGIPSPGGKENWSTATVYSMLQNEKYKGAALLQKEFTTDFLTKKRKVNEGEVPQYFVENSHPAIIDPKLWELTQIELERRKRVGKSYSAAGLFAGRILCGECGAFYGPRSWINKKDGKRTVWRCGKKYGRANTCDSPILTEGEIKEKFVSAFNEIYDDREIIIDKCRKLLAELDDNSDIDEKIREHELECEVLAEMNLKLMKDSAITDWDKSDVREQIDLNVRKYEEKYARMEKLRTLKQERIRRSEKLSLFMFSLLDRGGVIEDFDEKLWIATVDRVEVQADGRMVFHFKNGTEVKR